MNQLFQSGLRRETINFSAFTGFFLETILFALLSETHNGSLKLN